jgi:hypothetical protein
MVLLTVLLKKRDVAGRPETLRAQKSPYLVENTGFFGLSWMLLDSELVGRRLLNTAF